MPSEHTWTHLSRQRLGRYAEYFVKMRFTLAGLDVYTPEVDDRGLDFVVRARPGRFYEFQVKSGRASNNYVFMQKAHFDLAPDLYLALVLFTEAEEPSVYLIPSTMWLEPIAPFTRRDYEGRKSPPEWGLALTKAGRLALEEYRFERQVSSL